MGKKNIMEANMNPRKMLTLLIIGIRYHDSRNCPEKNKGLDAKCDKENV